MGRVVITGGGAAGMAAAIGADRVEIYTGPYAEAFAAGTPTAALSDCAGTARRAQDAGLGVNAGHDLDQANLGPLLSAVPADSMRLAREMAEIRSVSGVVAAAPWTASTSW